MKVSTDLELKNSRKTTWEILAMLTGIFNQDSNLNCQPNFANYAQDFLIDREIS